MAKRILMSLHISAPPARVFEDFDGSLSLVALRGGGMDRDRGNEPFGAGAGFSLRYALVTMPNVAHWAGRLTFLLRGEHHHFEEGDLRKVITSNGTFRRSPSCTCG